MKKKRKQSRRKFSMTAKGFLVFFFCFAVASLGFSVEKLQNATSQAEKEIASVPPFPLNATQLVQVLEVKMEQLGNIGRNCTLCHIDQCITTWLSGTNIAVIHYDWLSRVTSDASLKEAAAKFWLSLMEDVHDAWHEKHGAQLPIVRNTTHWRICWPKQK